ncbi:hypothetical protein [Clostridium botulinum]|uniref:Uncharacterized protein n=1 Tax=Clostridium botulinum (strain Langeland / NCTC 10281 / Type F) TaxID=441772 RepID=A7GEG3_CLOBL|nr:hypothetical protein [Clostridium botulinum]ABS42327.1 hypothetical protein CLI_1915 [Clostridium botulinum F str. Langeland]ADF99591.1 hypothetical protein CBF_1896 [Clostridium botulinum F str. 230613]KKM42832.1 hypothetical protein VT72_04110 [Clostridium botulinum]MBY6791649.1 hypothetical protein [Clostridium botulinum]MBY6936885.1 hypothetical protein [Clostridium botulinum]
MDNNKMYEAIVEVNTKGSLQEQAKKLYDEEKLYKKLIDTYNKEMQEIDDDELLTDLYLMRKKYKIRLDHTKNEMCYLNKRIIDTLDVIEKYVDVDMFCKLFEIEEYDEEDDYYGNILGSTSKIGYVCRTGLIYNEKLAKEIIEEDRTM